jgi:hypothetical protein
VLLCLRRGAPDRHRCPASRALHRCPPA